MKNIIIRKISPKDWANLLRLIKDLLHDTPPTALELEGLATHTQEWIERFPHESQGIFVVAEDTGGSEIIGFGYLVTPNYRKRNAFIGIALAKKYRQNKIGTTIYYRLAEWAAQSNIQFITADIWDGNTSSLHFFEQLNFEEINHFDDIFHGEQRGKRRLIKRI
jgi:RimJ/RimL family protein N-acetyltransferase